MTNPPAGGAQPGPHGQPYGPAGAYPPPGGPHGQPPHAGPQYGPPQYGQPPHAGPQYGPPQYGQPQYGQAPFGQPPYGQPPYGAPPRKPRAGLIAGVVALALVILALAIVLPLVLGTEVLDRGQVERDVAAQFEQAHGVAVDVRCDQQMTVETGATYECAGTTADGEEITLRIAVTDEDVPAYTWEEV